MGLHGRGVWTRLRQSQTTASPTLLKSGFLLGRDHAPVVTGGMAPKPLALVLLLIVYVCLYSTLASESADGATSPTHESLLRCLASSSQSSAAFFPQQRQQLLAHGPDSPSYNQLLQHRAQNLRFFSPSTAKPAVIIVPSEESHVQAAVKCCRRRGLLLRVRSGGHDYEGLSYSSGSASHPHQQQQPFVVLDLKNLSSVRVDSRRGEAWVGTGTTIGELYYNVWKQSKGRLGFPAGLCPQVGVGGLVGGGGLGMLLRKHGLSADNVVDARLVDAAGRVLDRASMGEDLFWAIRGGGAASFGVVVAWKLRLVPVPATVTAFTVARGRDQGGVQLLSKWQRVGASLPDDLMIRVTLQRSNTAGGRVAALFEALYLGNCTSLLRIMRPRFPELRLQPGDCREMSWIQSALYFAGLDHGRQPLEALLDKATHAGKYYFKGKSDFVTNPIPKSAWGGPIWSKLEEDGGNGMMIMDPFGGRMSQIPETATPFPHRRGNLFNIQYIVNWDDEGPSAVHARWLSELYQLMTPYVSKNPRGAYVNYRDLDLGGNGCCFVSGGGGRAEGAGCFMEAARGWGAQYFKGNFERLARVKGRVDPGNFFRNEQSVPPLLLPSATAVVNLQLSGFVPVDES